MKILKRQTLFFIIKVLVIISSFCFILYKFFNYENIAEVFKAMTDFGNRQFVLLGLIIFLVFINWFIEALKWKKLLLPIEHIGWMSSYKAVLAGITVSMFTPNRTGEFLGRVLILSPEKRIDGIAATIIGSFSQFLITVLFGLTGASYLFFSGKILPEISFSWKAIILFFCVLTVIALFIYFNIKGIFNYILSLDFFGKFKKYLYFIKQYQKQDLLKVMLFSLARYMVFVVQFYLLFHIFNIDIEFLHCFAGVGMMYFIMAVIPTFTIAELGVRGSVAILVFEIFTTNIFGIVATSVLLWIFNLAVPALIGSILFYKMKI